MRKTVFMHTILMGALMETLMGALIETLMKTLMKAMTMLIHRTL